jgi:cytochrome c553
MKKLQFASFFTLTLLAMPGFVSAAGDAAAGENIVAACGACHGANGNSESPANPKLAGQSEKYLLKQLNDIKSGARDVALMTGQLDAMSEADLENIAAYYAGQIQTPGAADADQVALGSELYRNGNHERGIPACMGCHGPAGQGIAAAGYPMIAGQHASYIADQLRNFSAGSRNNDGEGRAMRGVAERLNETEIKALASYIEGLRR